VALFLNTTGSQNTATGTAALLHNTDGAGHTAVGFNALATATAGASAFAATEQQKQIEALTANLQKVSAQLAAASSSGGGLEASKPAPHMVLNNQ
jgi:hypothetical protein